MDYVAEESFSSCCSSQDTKAAVFGKFLFYDGHAALQGLLPTMRTSLASTVLSTPLKHFSLVEVMLALPSPRHTKYAAFTWACLAHCAAFVLARAVLYWKGLKP